MKDRDYCKLKTNGFTIMEVSIALGIFSIIAVSVIGSFLTFFPKAHDIRIEKELSDDLESIYNLIENKIKEADFVLEPLPASTSNRLILRYSESVRDPTIFSTVNNDLYLEEGAGQSYVRKKINANYFLVESLNFTNISNDPGSKDIKIDLKITFKKDNKSVESSQTYSSFPEDETIIVLVPPPVITFSASPDVIVEGDSSILVWSTQYADSCSASGGWKEAQNTSGTQIIKPTLTTTYILSCAGEGGSSVESVVVRVIPRLSVSCSASPNPALVNQPVTFTASASGGTGTYTYSWSGACTGSNSSCTKSFSSSGNYTATVQVSSGTQTVSTSCQIKINPLPPTLTFSADPTSIQKGESSTLIWSSSNTNFCVASGGWSGNKPVMGSQQVSPLYTTTYNLTCYGDNSEISRQVEVRVFIDQCIGEDCLCRPFIRCECIGIRCSDIEEPPPSDEPPPPGSGGGGGSVIGYTIISGSGKKIEDIRSKDTIYGFKEGHIINQTVEAVWSKEPSSLTIYRLKGDSFDLELTGNHLVWVNDAWLPARDIKVGDFLTILDSENSKLVLQKVTQISKRKIWVRTYTLKTDLGHYFAGGVMVKNAYYKKM